jgi:hypothetical protein
VLAEVVIARPAICTFFEGVEAKEGVAVEAVAARAASVKMEMVLVLSSDFIDSP